MTTEPVDHQQDDDALHDGDMPAPYPDDTPGGALDEETADPGDRGRAGGRAEDASGLHGSSSLPSRPDSSNMPDESESTSSG
jgi:hypothetical protein